MEKIEKKKRNLIVLWKAREYKHKNMEREATRKERKQKQNVIKLVSSNKERRSEGGRAEKRTCKQ